MSVTPEFRQRVMENLGKNGCYFLSVVHIAEEFRKTRIDAIPEFLSARDKKWIADDCTMQCPDSVFTELASYPYTVTKENPEYIPLPGEYEVLVFAYNGMTHFVVGSYDAMLKKDVVAYDPLGNSNCVAKGTIESKRVFHPKK